LCSFLPTPFNLPILEPSAALSSLLSDVLKVCNSVGPDTKFHTGIIRGRLVTGANRGTADDAVLRQRVSTSDWQATPVAAPCSCLFA
jgi:hypothetical protein